MRLRIFEQISLSRECETVWPICGLGNMLCPHIPALVVAQSHRAGSTYVSKLDTHLDAAYVSTLYILGRAWAI